MPVANLDRVFEDNPAWVEPLGKVENVMGGAQPTTLSTLPRQERTESSGHRPQTWHEVVAAA
jgi:hypothetical protein